MNRFDWFENFNTHNFEMLPADDGSWVKWETIERLIAELCTNNTIENPAACGICDNCSRIEEFCEETE